MYDAGGDGWGNITWTISSDGVESYTGRLSSGSFGITYFCLEDAQHAMIIDETDSEISWSVHDMFGGFFVGKAPGERCVAKVQLVVGYLLGHPGQANPLL